MSLIYKITNKLNNQSYIGKTTRTFQTRMAEHKRDSKQYLSQHENTIPLYNAVGKYGWENFIFEILEENVKDEELNLRERYYIGLYDTYHHGYNATQGGDGGRTSSKLTHTQVNEIIQILLDDNNLQPMIEIAQQFNIDKTTIVRINNGESWRQAHLNYPLRKYNVTGLTLNKATYQKIIDEIITSDLTLSQIAQKYQLSEEQITAINCGYECYNNQHPYYHGIYQGDFPIRRTNQKIVLTDDIVQNILYDILFTKLSMEKIGNKYNISGNTLTYIANGKRRKEITKDFVVPLRRNLQTNQKIYTNIYLDTKEVIL